MKRIILFITVQVICFSCILERSEENGIENELHFKSVSIESALLSGKVVLVGDLDSHELLLTAELKNITSGKIRIKDIRVETESGIQARPNDPMNGPIDVASGAKITLTTRFTPINDFESYMLTGKEGLFNKVYFINLTVADSEGLKTVRVQSMLADNDFTIYRRSSKQAIIGYKYCKSAWFENRQREYLDSIQVGTDFIHVSKQEIAIAGLNFRLQCYWENDSLNAKLFVVNHAEFQIMLDTAAFDIIDQQSDAKRKLSFYKVTGSKHEPNLLRKGDRIVIELAKYLPDTTGVSLEMAVKRAFMFEGGRDLFVSNPLIEKI